MYDGGSEGAGRLWFFVSVRSGFARRYGPFAVSSVFLYGKIGLMGMYDSNSCRVNIGEVACRRSLGTVGKCLLLGLALGVIRRE